VVGTSASCIATHPSDMAVGLRALDAVVETVRPDGQARRIPIADFHRLPGNTPQVETALEPGELITAVSFPTAQKAAYVKFKQPASRFALIGVCVAQTGGGVRVAVTGARSHVFRAAQIEAALAKSFTPEAAKAVKMPTAEVNADLHGSAEYRAAMISVIASRAVAAALAR